MLAAERVIKHWNGNAQGSGRVSVPEGVQETTGYGTQCFGLQGGGQPT